MTYQNACQQQVSFSRSALYLCYGLHFSTFVGKLYGGGCDVAAVRTNLPSGRLINLMTFKFSTALLHLPAARAAVGLRTLCCMPTTVGARRCFCRFPMSPVEQYEAQHHKQPISCRLPPICLINPSRHRVGMVSNTASLRVKCHTQNLFRHHEELNHPARRPSISTSDYHQSFT